MNPTIEIIYGSRLRSLRMNRQLVQKQAADLCGFESQQIISMLENGEKKFSDDIINSICKGFEIPLEEFTNINSTINFNNSPHAKNHSDHNNVNDITLINALQTAFQQTLLAKEQTIEAHKQNLKSKDETLNARDREIEKYLIIDKMKEEKLNRNQIKIEELRNEVKLLKEINK